MIYYLYIALPLIVLFLKQKFLKKMFVWKHIANIFNLFIDDDCERLNHLILPIQSNHINS